jgi:hypothetical protein
MYNQAAGQETERIRKSLFVGSIDDAGQLGYEQREMQGRNGKTMSREGLTGQRRVGVMYEQ